MGCNQTISFSKFQKFNTELHNHEAYLHILLCQMPIFGTICQCFICLELLLCGRIFKGSITRQLTKKSIRRQFLHYVVFDVIKKSYSVAIAIERLYMSFLSQVWFG